MRIAPDLIGRLGLPGHRKRPNKSPSAFSFCVKHPLRRVFLRVYAAAKLCYNESAMIRLIAGRAGSGKTARIFKDIAERCARREEGLILIVPEQYSHEAERELCAAAGDGMSASAEVLSFTALARKVFAECGGARPMLDGGGRLLCMAAAVETLGESLRLYRGARQEPRQLAELLRAVDELKNAGLDSAALLRAAEESEPLLAEKLRELALVAEAFAARQAQAGADSADALQTLAALIGDSLSVKGRFYIDGFSDFTVLELQVLEAMMAAGAEMLFCITCGAEEDDELFALPRRTLRRLEDCARAHGQKVETEWLERESESPIAFYADRLFSFGAAEAPEVGEAICLTAASSVAEECELAAARMHALARAGCRWRDMAVAVRGFEDYRAPLESACERYGVPLFLSGRSDILQKSLPLAIEAALEAVERGYEYEAMFSYLKTGFAGFAAAELDQLENYVLLWGLRGAVWTRPFWQHPEGYDRPESEQSLALLAQLNAQREAIIAPLEALRTAGNAAQTAAEQAEALAEFLLRLQIPEQLEARAAELDARGMSETAAEYGRLWDVICTALEQFAAALGAMPMSRARFAALFRQMLGQYDVNVIPVSLDRVQAGEADKMRRRHLRHLLVLGATGERLPAPAGGGGLFSPEERESLSALGFALGDAEEELSREFGLVYNCLSLPSDTLYISRSLTDGEGGESRPSMVMERASALLGLREERGDLTAARMETATTAWDLALLAAAGDRRAESVAARALFERGGRGADLARLGQAARQSRQSLSPEAVRRLYGKNPALSATRAEKFNACRFGYFLQYGLKAKPRQPAVFDPRDYGSFLHEVLEKVARGAMERGGFDKVTRADIEALADQSMDEYIHRVLEDFADKSPRFQYLFRRLRRTVRLVAVDLWEELRVSHFRPLAIELDLAEEGVLSPEESETARFRGRVDRVDGWLKDGTLYLRVTDYKSGKKKLSLSDISYGMDMQMLLYLFTLQARGGDWLKSSFGAEEVTKIQPAGVLYMPARQSVETADCEPDGDEPLSGGDRRRSGLLLDDAEVLEAMEGGEPKRFLPLRMTKNGPSGDALTSAARFGALGRHIEQTLAALAAELRAGSVEADPWFKSARDNACEFCDMKEACLFDESCDRRRAMPNLRAPEAWERIEHGQV